MAKDKKIGEDKELEILGRKITKYKELLKKQDDNNEELKKVLSKHGDGKDKKDNNAKEVQRIKDEQKKLDKDLLKENLNVQDQQGETMLHTNIQKDNDAVVMLLLNNSELVNLDLQNDKRKTPLHLACEKSKYEIIEKLVEKKANLNIKDNDGDTALNILLKKYVPNNDTNKELDAENDKINKAAELLIQNDVNYLIQNNKEENALDIAIKTNNINIVNIIAEKELEKQQIKDEKVKRYIKELKEENINNGIKDRAIEKYVDIKMGNDAFNNDTIQIADIEDIAKLYTKNKDENKIEVPKRKEISQKKMDEKITKEPVYIRGLSGLSGVIKNDKDHTDTLRMKYNETGVSMEMNKLIRMKGNRTLTKFEGEKEGNPNRCFTMINFGKVEPYVKFGYGVTDIDTSRMHLVSDIDAWSFVNKEEGIIEKKDNRVKKCRDNPSMDIEIRRIFNNLEGSNLKTKMSRAEILKSHEKKAKNQMKQKQTKEHNEVIIDITENDVSFIYYYAGKNSNDIYEKLQATYFKRKYEERTNRVLPIFEYKLNEVNCLEKREIDDKDIPDMLIKEMTRPSQVEGKIVRTLGSEYSSIKSADFWIVFKDEIKEIAEKRGIDLVKQFKDAQDDKRLNIYDVINLFKVIKEFKGKEEIEKPEYQEELVKRLDKILDTEKILNFIDDRTVRKSYVNKRLNRKVDFWFDMVSQIYGIATDKTKQELQQKITDISNEIYRLNKEEDKEKGIEKTLNNGLMYAVKEGNCNLVEKLIESGADINNIKKEELKNIKNNKNKMVELLKTKGLKIGDTVKLEQIKERIKNPNDLDITR